MFDSGFAGDVPRQIWGHDHLRLAVDAACVALWSWNLADDRFAMDERGFELWGRPWAGTVSLRDLSAHIQPADRDRVQSAFTATRSVPGPYEIDCDLLAVLLSTGEGTLDVTGRTEGNDVFIIWAESGDRRSSTYPRWAGSAAR